MNLSNHKQRDIIICLPKTTSWHDYQDELDRAERGELLNFKVRYFPTNSSPGCRCYICHDGEIKGYHLIHMFSTGKFECTSTGRVWQGRFIQRTGKFHKITPVKHQSFRGWKYSDTL